MFSKKLCETSNWCLKSLQKGYLCPSPLSEWTFTLLTLAVNVVNKLVKENLRYFLNMTF